MDSQQCSTFAEGTPSEQSQASVHLMSTSMPSSTPRLARGVRVPSLIFDLDLEDGGVGAAWHPDEADCWEEEEVVAEIQRFVAPQSAAEARLMGDAKTALAHARDGQEFARLAQILTALGYRVQVRTALGGGDGADCLRNLRHTFVTVTLPQAGALAGGAAAPPPRKYVVDPLFKEQFFIAKSTARYAAILAAVPQVFVGPEEHLLLLVNFLCSEMSSAFKQLGGVLPPWRHASSMLSKWQPRKSMEQEAATPAAAPAAAPRPQPQAQQQQQQAQQHLAALLGSHHKPAAASGMPWQPQPFYYQQQHHAAGGYNKAPAAARERPSWEPQRVYMGGNFVPITPAPAS